MIFKKEDSKHKIKTIKPGDSGWYIKGELTITPRAGFEIPMECPAVYKEIIQKCINFGWLKPVAHVKESEYIWEKLGE